MPYQVFTGYLPGFSPGYLPVLPPNSVFTRVNTQVNTRSVFTCRFLRSPYSQICEISRNFEKIRNKMGNKPVGKKVNTPKGKYPGKYLLRKYLGIYLFT